MVIIIPSGSSVTGLMSKALDMFLDHEEKDLADSTIIEAIWVIIARSSALKAVTASLDGMGLYAPAARTQ
jgi:hypothetical protein